MPNTKESDSVMINIDTKQQDDSQYQEVDNRANAPQTSYVQKYKEARKYIAKNVARGRRLNAPRSSYVQRYKEAGKNMCKAAAGVYVVSKLGLLGSRAQTIADIATEVTGHVVDEVIDNVVEKASEAGCSIM